jgi:CBS domain-containing protein
MENRLFVMTTKETFTLHGENLLKKVKELIAEGNIRKITITDKEGKELMSIPLTLGVVGAIFAPVLAGVGAIAAVIGECSITVERDPPKEDLPKEDPQP